MLWPRLRWCGVWVVGGAAALFVANLFGGRAMLVAVGLLGGCWLLLALDGVRTGWRWRGIGIPALLLVLLPVVAVPFAGFAGGRVLYWSHVAPSWWSLRSHGPAFDAALAGGELPPGAVAVDRDGNRTAFRTIGDPSAHWAGIVHDPTDRLTAARGWNGGPVGRDIAAMFGSTTIWCQRLDSHWFHCQFG
ncbi:hypothetical protein [Sphingomonas sp. Leaf4]|uniref:hypothetical protein n=1 Tax=Sphingomonas sp. Leaf4 TaxID=2876553 RepID=UPI001E3F3595|nr:hypothetical protein [Sphingomonas sp. Leaf4]